nr:MAG TPA: hypothetical protein [Caudoviricetes sp.]
MLSPCVLCFFIKFCLILAIIIQTLDMSTTFCQILTKSFFLL